MLNTLEIFSLNTQSAALLLIGILLYVSSKPLLQGWSKFTETLIFLFGGNPDPKSKNLMKSAQMSPCYQDIIGDTVLREPVFPGLLIFSLFLVGAPTQLSPTSTSVDIANIIIFATMGFFFGLFRLISATRKSSTRSTIPLSHLLSGGLAVAIFIFGWQMSFPLEASISLLILSCFFAQVAATSARGFRNYGLFAIFWIPPAIFCWATRVFAIAILGPIALIANAAESLLDSTHSRKPSLN